jgi:hypothetical protein
MSLAAQVRAEIDIRCYLGVFELEWRMLHSSPL